jgi:hypothetical protein
LTLYAQIVFRYDLYQSPDFMPNQFLIVGHMLAGVANLPSFIRNMAAIKATLSRSFSLNLNSD